MNRLYDKTVTAAQTTRPMNLLAGSIKAVMVDLGAYTPDFVNDEFLSDVPSGARFGTPVALTGKTVTGRVFNANPATVTGLVSAPTLEAVLLFEDTGTASTSPLIALIDTATGLPAAAGATQATVTWATTSNKIFKL